MSKKAEELNETFGLLASGSCRLWHIDVDESLDGNRWYFDLDGPTCYLVFQLKDLQVIRDALKFLQYRLGGSGVQIPRGPEKGDQELCLGQFGSASVWLLWDDEETLRCFLVVGPRAQATLRITLLAEDIEMIVDALRQVVQDLPESSSSPAGKHS
jgi:hypothetical protein